MSDTTHTPGHTPGPWSWNDDALYITAPIENHVYGASWLIADLPRHRLGSADNRPPEEVRAANARLIAAAPTMYDLLLSALDYYCQTENDNAPTAQGIREVLGIIHASR